MNKLCTIVVQVGLGGEYDATNVVNAALSIICSVCKSHNNVFICMHVCILYLPANCITSLSAILH